MQKKEKMCLLFSDASFSIKDNVSIISFVNLSNKQKQTKRLIVNNILEAEKEAIIFALKSALSKCKNVIVFSDNLFAVLDLKKTILRKKNNTPFRVFHYMDIVWLPREYNFADFFTKFLDENFLVETLSEKIKIINEKEKKYKNIYEELDLIMSSSELLDKDNVKDNNDQN